MAEVKLNLQADLTGNIKQEIDAVASSLERMERSRKGASFLGSELKETEGETRLRDYGERLGRGYREVTSAANELAFSRSRSGRQLQERQTVIRQEQSLDAIRNQIAYFQSPEGRRIEQERQRLQEQLEEARLPRPSLGERLGGKAWTELGGFGRAALVGGAAGAGLTAVAAVADRAAKSLNILANSSMSAVDKQEALAATWIPFYDKLAGLRDAISGVTESLRVMRMEAEANTIRGQAAVVRNVGEMGALRDAFGARATADAYRNNPLGGRVDAADLMSSSGRNAYQDALAIQSAQDALVRANRARDAAIAVRDRDERIFRGVAFRRDAAGMALRGAQREIEADRRRQERMSAGERWLMGDDLRLGQQERHNAFGAAQATVEVVQAEYARAQQAARESAGRAEEAITASKRAQLDIDKEQLAILERREQRMSSLQQRIGSLNEAEYRSATNALTSVRRYGLQASTSESIRLAELIAPQEISRLRNERAIARLPGQAATFGTARDDLADYAEGQTQLGLQGRIVSIRARLSSQMDAVEGDLSRGMADVVSTAMERLLKNFRDEFSKRITEIENRQLQRGAGQ